jgi:ubiquinone/menaquinone biosynthesis C-methylase UbiE/DNA-binding transcriptional ArsR family regulator
MPSLAKILRAAADANRLRILLLLEAEELSVAELQEILAMGQSTISTHLSQLKQAGLVEDRRAGKSSLYRLAPQPAEEPSLPKKPDLSRKSTGSSFKGTGSSSKGTGSSLEGTGSSLEGTGSSSKGTGSSSKGTGFSPYINTANQNGALAPGGHTLLAGLLTRAAAEIPEAASDAAAMRRVLRKRQDKMRAFFDSVAGRLGRDYVPGKSWKSIAEALLRLMLPMTIADLGAGEGAFALLLAQRAEKVIAVDSSSRMIDVGRDQAARHGVQNIDFRLGDMEELPIGSAEVDLVFFSQSLHHALHPPRALEEAWRILVPGGRVAILDLARHRFEEARELYADQWLGFSEAGLESMLEKAGFHEVHASIVDKEPESPQFQTLLAVGDKPRRRSA